MFVVAIILAVVFVIALLAAVFMEYKLPAVITALVALVASLGFLFAASTYTNDEGQAKVLLSWTSEVQGDVTTPGFGWKAPWQKALTYDVRNQQVKFGSHKGEVLDGANGPQITVQDKEGVSANIDITVRYSIKPGSVVDIYSQYGSESDFVAKFIENDIRAGVRTVPGGYGTVELLTQRPAVEKDITDYLKKRWADSGVQVESVSLQDIRYPKDVRQRFAEAQNARTEVEKANAELETNRIKAESNRVLTESLSPANLEQLKYETLAEIGKKGNLIIVPENFGGMINLPTK